MLYDHRGNLVSPSQKLKNDIPNVTKKAFGQYGNIYSYPNYGRFRPRYYTLGDTNQGLDTLSRELLVRWSREMFGQLPLIKAAIRALADFAIGNSYLPQYHGTNKSWWKEAEEWLLSEWYPNCSVRGSHYDFQTSLRLESQLLDVDGDYLLVYGTEDDFPKYQLIQNNRIRHQGMDNYHIAEGEMKGTIISDGVYYTSNGRAVAYHIQNSKNMVNQMVSQTSDLIVYTKDATLILDPEFIDKLRGVPAIGAAILQALSIQELDSYLMEKIKIESTIALVMKTPSGEAPQELQDTLAALENMPTNLGPGPLSPNVHALEVRQGSEIRYIHAEGGEIKTLNSNSPANETAEYIKRLETQVLSTIGIPHQLIYSTDRITGRAASAVAEIFRNAINRRQAIMDKTAKFRVAWALAKAMDKGIIAKNDNENISRAISFSHPPDFSLDAQYDNNIVLNNYQAGLASLNSATIKLYNKSAEQTLDEQKKEQVMFYTRAQQVSKETGVPLNTVLAGWHYNQKVTAPPQAEQATDEASGQPG